jgi:hypothetical protein
MGRLGQMPYEQSPAGHLLAGPHPRTAQSKLRNDLENCRRRLLACLPPPPRGPCRPPLQSLLRYRYRYSRRGMIYSAPDDVKLLGFRTFHALLDSWHLGAA